MKTLLVGFGSKAQIGKDFACAGLKQFYDVERVAFADALKTDIATLFMMNNLSLDMLLNVPDLKRMVRPLLCEYGACMRQFNPDVWVDRALTGREFNHDITIITDVRHPNEVDRIKSLGGVYVEIDADVPPANETEAHYHPILKGMADYTVRNNFDGHFMDDMVVLVGRLLDKKSHENSQD